MNATHRVCQVVGGHRPVPVFSLYSYHYRSGLVTVYLWDSEESCERRNCVPQGPASLVQDLRLQDCKEVSLLLKPPAYGDCGPAKLSAN